MYHVPVLLHESVSGLAIQPDGIYVDATFGGGGHSREILKQLGEKGRLFGFDQDADAWQNAPQGESRFTFVHSNFRFLKNWMRFHAVETIDGLIADLGVSGHHFDSQTRGFSFRFEAPLDMRMNARSPQTAADVANSYSQEQLAEMLYNYGELKSSRRLAAAIVEARKAKAFKTVQDLLVVVQPLLPREREKKDLARVFQAFRIEVNHEMQALQELLSSTVDLLKPGGRFVVLTYHSLEDRLVKNFIRAGKVDGRVEQDFYGKRLAPLRAVNSKVIVPSPEEQAANPRSRSAKLRVAERV